MAAAAQVVAARTLPMWRDWVSGAGSHAVHAAGGPTLRVNRHGCACAPDGGRRSAQRSLLPATAHPPPRLGTYLIAPLFRPLANSIVSACDATNGRRHATRSTGE